MRAFFASMTGRLFVILTVGVWLAAIVATAAAAARASRAFQEQILKGAAQGLSAHVRRLNATSGASRAAVLAESIPGFGVLTAPAAYGQPDDEFERALRNAGRALGRAQAFLAPPATCFPPQRGEQGPPPLGPLPPQILPPVCRLIAIRLEDGTALRMSHVTPPIASGGTRVLDPFFLASLAGGATLLSYLVARLASAPLVRMSIAAEELGKDLDREPIAVAGPTEVRRAAEALNLIQSRMRQHMRERTGMLAAISHDLQTPLTRLKLRLEQVEEESLRARLNSDVTAMAELVNEGLELARGAGHSESRLVLDLDSLLDSLVQDAIDAGADASYAGGSPLMMKLYPQATRRLFSNLIDNALKYGGCAIVSLETSSRQTCVRVRDTGPGLPQGMLERVLEPFVRLEEGRVPERHGTGLGLAIARMLAEKNGATLVLRNHQLGGLEAVVTWTLAEKARLESQPAAVAASRGG